MVDDDEVVDITSFVFRDLYTNIVVDKIDVPDYLNEYFVKIAKRTSERPNDIMNEYVECYEIVMSTFDFIPPAIEEIYGYMSDIDINTASCIPGINSRVCKIMLDKIPAKFCHLFANS